MGHWTDSRLTLLLAALACVLAAGCSKTSSSSSGSDPVNSLLPAGPAAEKVTPGGAPESDTFAPSDPSFGVGPDGVAQFAYLRVIDSDNNSDFVDGTDVSQVMYVRRRADGTWSTPIGLSAATTVFRGVPQLVVVPTGANADQTFVFWQEGAAGVGRLFLSRIGPGDPPVVLTGGSTGTVISNGLPSGLPGGTGVGAAQGPTPLADTVDGSVYLMWQQNFGAPAHACYVVGRYALGGAGTVAPVPNQPDELIALTDLGGNAGPVFNPAFGPYYRLVFSPVPKVGTGGTMHAVYDYTAAGPTISGIWGASRTATGTWTAGPPGSRASSVANAASYDSLTAAVDGNGDLYVAWVQEQGGTKDSAIRFTHRTAGTTVFDADVPVAPVNAVLPMIGTLALAMDGSTPVLAYHRSDAGGTQVAVVGVVGTAGRSGPFGAEVFLRDTIAGSVGLGRIGMIRESSHQIGIAYEAPSTSGTNEIFGVVRPSGGNFSTQIIISRDATNTPNLSRFVGIAGSGGTTGTVVFLQGPDAGPRAVCTVDYSAGVFQGGLNRSNAGASDTHGSADIISGALTPQGVGLYIAPSGVTYLWWILQTGALQDAVSFSEK